MGHLGACRELQQSLQQQQQHLHPSSTSQLEVCASTSPGSPWHPPKRDLLTDKEEQRGKSPFWGVLAARLIPIRAKPWAAELSLSPAPCGAGIVFEQGWFPYPDGKCCCPSTRGGTHRGALGAGPGSAPRAPGEDGCGPWLPHSLSVCTELDPGAGRDGCGEEPSPWLGRCREEPGSWKRLWSCLHNSCFASSSLSSPASSCRSILGFIASPFCDQPPISGPRFLKKGPLAGSEAPAMPANIPRESFQPPAGFSRGRFRAELPRGPWPAR